MIRAVLDTNVLVAGLLSSSGPPAALLRAWRDARFELVVSPHLVTELDRVLAYRRIRSRITEDQADRFLSLLHAGAQVLADPGTPSPVPSRDPDDDYLVTLAATARSMLVSGDRDLLTLAPRVPVHEPHAFLDLVLARTADG